MTLAEIRNAAREHTAAATASLPRGLFAEQEVPWQATARGHLAAALAAIPRGEEHRPFAQLLTDALAKVERTVGAPGPRSHGAARWSRGPEARALYLTYRTAMSQKSFSAPYRAAMAECGGRCPIEAGVLGRLADHECRHGRLPFDRTRRVAAGRRKAPPCSRCHAGRGHAAPPGARHEPTPTNE